MEKPGELRTDRAVVPCPPGWELWTPVVERGSGRASDFWKVSIIAWAFITTWYRGDQDPFVYVLPVTADENLPERWVLRDPSGAIYDPGVASFLSAGDVLTYWNEERDGASLPNPERSPRAEG
jgi:hypothetical protein